MLEWKCHRFCFFMRINVNICLFSSCRLDCMSVNRPVHQRSALQVCVQVCDTPRSSSLNTSSNHLLNAGYFERLPSASGYERVCPASERHITIIFFQESSGVLGILTPRCHFWGSIDSYTTSICSLARLWSCDLQWLHSYWWLIALICCSFT